MRKQISMYEAIGLSLGDISTEYMWDYTDAQAKAIVKECMPAVKAMKEFVANAKKTMPKQLEEWDFDFSFWDPKEEDDDEFFIVMYNWWKGAWGDTEQSQETFNAFHKSITDTVKDALVKTGWNYKLLDTGHGFTDEVLEKKIGSAFVRVDLYTGDNDGNLIGPDIVSGGERVPQSKLVVFGVNPNDEKELDKVHSAIIDIKPETIVTQTYEESKKYFEKRLPKTFVTEAGEIINKSEQREAKTSEVARLALVEKSIVRAINFAVKSKKTNVAAIIVHDFHLRDPKSSGGFFSKFTKKSGDSEVRKYLLTVKDVTIYRSGDNI